MKRYLAFYGWQYYPFGGMRDFLSHRDTLEEAEKAAIAKSEENIDEEDDPWEYDWAHIYDSEKDEIVREW